MTKEAMNKLSQLVRDRDLEIKALKERNQGLVDLIKNQGDAEGKPHQGTNKEVDGLEEKLATAEKERQQYYDALTQKHQESLAYYSEIERLTKVLSTTQQQQQQLQQQQQQLSSCPEKSVIDNSNEILVLKSKIRELERRLEASSATQQQAVQSRLRGRRRFNSEVIDGREHDFDNDENEDKSRLEAEKRALEDKLQEATRRSDFKEAVSCLRKT